MAWSKVLLTVQSDTDLTLIVGPICTAVELQNNEEKKKKKKNERSFSNILIF